MAGLVALGALSGRISRFIDGGHRFVLGQISVAGAGIGTGAGFTAGGLLRRQTIEAVLRRIDELDAERALPDAVVAPLRAHHAERLHRLDYRIGANELENQLARLANEVELLLIEAERKYLYTLLCRGEIKDELLTVLKLAPAFQQGSADRALGRWYYKVPGLFGGSKTKSEEHLRRSLTYGPNSTASHFFLAETLFDQNRPADARAELQRVLDAPVDPDWGPEDREFKDKARRRLAAR